VQIRIVLFLFGYLGDSLFPHFTFQELSNDDMMGLVTNNPLLSNITDYLIEEASAEEEELLGKNSELEEGEEGEDGNTIVRDEELVKVLVSGEIL
jgi:hypothetical protein